MEKQYLKPNVKNTIKIIGTVLISGHVRKKTKLCKEELQSWGYKANIYTVLFKTG